MLFWSILVPLRIIIMNITYEDMDILYVYINVNYVCSIDHYKFGVSHRPFLN